MTEILSIHDADAQLTAAGQMFEVVETTIRGESNRVWKNAPASL